MDGYARPACLHTNTDEQDLKKATATGWGKLDYGKYLQPQLQYYKPSTFRYVK